MTKRIIPDTITCCNLLCGAVAVYMATQHAFIWAFLLILGGAFFDFFDGLSARALKAPSKIGSARNWTRWLTISRLVWHRQ